MDHTEGTYALAQVLQALFDRVVLVTPRERIAMDVPLVSALGIYRRLTRLGLEIIPLAEVGARSDLESARIDVEHVYTASSVQWTTWPC